MQKKIRRKSKESRLPKKTHKVPATSLSNKKTSKTTKPCEIDGHMTPGQKSKKVRFFAIEASEEVAYGYRLTAKECCCERPGEIQSELDC